MLLSKPLLFLPCLFYHAEAAADSLRPSSAKDGTDGMMEKDDWDRVPGAVSVLILGTHP